MPSLCNPGRVGLRVVRVADVLKAREHLSVVCGCTLFGAASGPAECSPSVECCAYANGTPYILIVCVCPYAVVRLALRCYCFDSILIGSFCTRQLPRIPK